MPPAWLDAILDFVLSPALALGALLALLYSLLFSALRGGGWRQAGRDILAGLIGFAAGQAAATAVNLNLLRVGELRLLGATLGAVLALLIGRFIATRLLVKQPPEKGRTAG